MQQIKVQKIQGCPKCGGRGKLGSHWEPCDNCGGTGKVVWGLMWVRGHGTVTLEELRKVVEFEDYKLFVECTKEECAKKPCQNT